MPKLTDLVATLELSRSGLRDSHRRSIMRLLFTISGVGLTVFGCLQILNGFWWVGAIDFLASAVLFFSIPRLRNTNRLQLWVYGYLITVFSYFLLIMLLPEASVTAFVWVLVMPALAHVLLGKRGALTLSVPFMVAGAVIYYSYLGGVSSPAVLIDFLNMAVCALLLLIFSYIYEMRREDAEKRLVDVAQTDAMTGLANRSCFQSALNRTIAECGRNGTGFAMVIMDVDHFKRVNDTLGHDAGDHALRHIGGCLTERLRATDSVGRLGGEEFGLILRDVKSSAAFELVDDLRQRIARSELAYGTATIRMTASFGIAQWPDHGRDAEELFRVADHRLYCSKRTGRNRIVNAGGETGLESADLAPVSMG